MRHQCLGTPRPGTEVSRAFRPRTPKGCPGASGGRKKQPKDKVFGQDISGTSGTQTSGYAGHKLYAASLFANLCSALKVYSQRSSWELVGEPLGKFEEV